MKILLASALALSACSARPQVITVPTADQLEAMKPGHMDVTGQATLQVSPDCADITITIIAVNLLGDGLQDALDPYGKRGT